MYVIFLILLLIFCIFICIIHKKFGGEYLEVCLENISDKYEFKKADNESDVLIIGYKKENGIETIIHSGKNNNIFETFVNDDKDYIKIRDYFVGDVKKAIFAMCENEVFAYVIDGKVICDDELIKELLIKKYIEVFPGSIIY